MSNGGSSSDDDINIRSYTPTGTPAVPRLVFSAAHGTEDAPLPLATGEQLGDITFKGQAGAGFPNNEAVKIAAYYDGSGTDNLSSLRILTSNQNRMTVASNGNVGINTLAPTAKLDINAGATAGFRLADSTPTNDAGKVLTSDANGVGTWQAQTSAPVITVQPRAFSWKEAIGAGNMAGIGGAATTISVTASGQGLTYQWYEVPRNANSAPVALSGATTAAHTPALSALGMRQYYCVVSNAQGSVKSDIAKVAVGCGAMTAEGTWRTFMCYNLGATATTLATQMTTAGNVYNSDAVGAVPATGYTGANVYSAVFGDLYQWGRRADGHEKRSSRNSATTNAPSVGPYTGFDATWANGGSEQVTSASVDYGKFIVNSSSATSRTAGQYGQFAPFDWNANPTSRNAFLWRNYRYTQNDPCANLGATGTNWRVPTQEEWGSIFRGDSGAGAPGIALANTWQWKAPGTTTNGSTGTAGGYEIKPDGVTTTLFLPAAGHRYNYNGQLRSPGVNGNYWSASAYGDFSHYLTFNSGNVIPAHYYYRAYGLSVRCIAEN
jgi:uncharacterized protein (TIGR02145 family)